MNLGNIMVNQGRTAAVLDWSGFYFCEPEYDIASIKIKFLYIAPFLTHMDYTEFYPKFITRYQRKIPIDTERMKYYEAVWCIRFLMWTEIIERLNAPGVQESLIQRFHEITGIMLKQS